MWIIANITKGKCQLDDMEGVTGFYFYFELWN